MICYLWKSLKPSIKFEIEQQDLESINFKEIVQRAVNTEVKAGLRSSTMVRNSDICCPRNHCLSNSIASKIQKKKIIAKNFPQEEPKVKEVKPILSRVAEASEPSKQARKDRKKKWHQEKRNKKQTLISIANAIEV